MPPKQYKMNKRQLSVPQGTVQDESQESVRCSLDTDAINGANIFPQENQDEEAPFDDQQVSSTNPPFGTQNGKEEEHLGSLSLRDMMKTLVGVVTMQAKQNQSQPQPQLKQNSHQSEFQKLATAFKGSSDSLEADEWLDDTIKIFDYLEYIDQERLDAATFMLRGDANTWWKMEKRTMWKDKQCTWKEFQTALNDKLFPEGIKILKANEFFNLKQGSMAVIEYEAKFSKLGKFAPSGLIGDDGALAHRFQEGLREPIKLRVKDSQICTYAESVGKALAVEEGIVRAQQARELQQKKKLKNTDVTKWPKFGKSIQEAKDKSK
ncbi:uncharacterized protein LOC143853459 [Tasmannia lanceolata]|uniref:uncharacterized protein LOC143853459 n=1 Tax=Tasmannia lanceolata TaxID=3420 RepID=UPI00406421FC